MGRRRKHDVFVIGEELPLTDTEVLREPSVPAEDQEPGGHLPPPGLGPSSPPSGARRQRTLAVLGIAGAAAAAGAVGVSALTGSGGPARPTSSSRSALVMGPAPRAATPPARAARPLPKSRRPAPVTHRPKRGRRAARKESGREPTPPPAPEDPSLPIAAPSPAVEEPATESAPPSSPPPAGGGEPGGTEDFGFER